VEEEPPPPPPPPPPPVVLQDSASIWKPPPYAIDPPDSERNISLGVRVLADGRIIGTDRERKESSGSPTEYNYLFSEAGADERFMWKGPGTPPWMDSWTPSDPFPLAAVPNAKAYINSYEQPPQDLHENRPPGLNFSNWRRHLFATTTEQHDLVACGSGLNTLRVRGYKRWTTHQTENWPTQDDQVIFGPQGQIVFDNHEWWIGRAVRADPWYPRYYGGAVPNQIVHKDVIYSAIAAGPTYQFIDYWIVTSGSPPGPQAPTGGVLEAWLNVTPDARWIVSWTSDGNHVWAVLRGHNVSPVIVKWDPVADTMEQFSPPFTNPGHIAAGSGKIVLWASEQYTNNARNFWSWDPAASPATFWDSAENHWFNSNQPFPGANTGIRSVVWDPKWKRFIVGFSGFMYNGVWHGHHYWQVRLTAYTP
jgi:hypothetical protein